MPVSYAIPPWLGQPADPAAHYSTGLQIGVRIGQENAARIYQQQQLLRQQAQDAFEREYQTAKLNLDMDKIRRQQTAMNTFQQLRAQGVAPEEALMQVGPDLGESINDTLRTIAMGKENEANMVLKKQQLAETQAYHQDIVAEREAARMERERAARAGEAETARFHRETAKNRDAQNRMRAEKAMENDAVLNQLNQQLFDANTAIESEQNSWFGPNQTKLTEAQKLANEAARAVEARKGQLLNQFGVKSIGGPEEAASEPAAVLPAQPASPSEQTGKVHVRNPNGKTGWIPESQLEEALAAGYQQL